MNEIQGLLDRYALTESWPTCAIKICRNSKWYQMRLFDAPLEHCKTVIDRLRRKGRQVKVTYLTGMGMESFEDHTDEESEVKESKT